MTLINLVPPQELTDKMLVSEYHQLPRVFAKLKRVMDKGVTPDEYRQQYPKYRMGKGHMKFFYGRLKFLCDRHISLIEEMLRRKMRPKYEIFKQSIEGIPKEWFGDWEPNEEDLALSREKIKERLSIVKVKKKRIVITPYNEHLMNSKGEIELPPPTKDKPNV